MKDSRITTTAGFLNLVDVLGRGGKAEWRALYQRARIDAAVREQIRSALPLVDPEIGSARELWVVPARAYRTTGAPVTDRMNGIAWCWHLDAAQSGSPCIAILCLK